MSSEHKVVYLDTAKPTPSALELVDGVRQLAVKRLSALLRHMLDNVDDALFNRAERAESDSTQELYFYAMRQMRLRRREIEEAFQRELLADFRTLTASAPPAQEPGGDASGEDEPELGLVDEEALELSVATDAMSSRAASRMSLTLEQLRTRLDYLLSDRRVEETSNPLHPRCLTNAFERAAEPAELPIQPQLIILKLFEKYVLGQLPGLCDEANRQLIEGGVLPRLNAGRQQTQGGVRSQSPRPPRGDDTGERDTDAQQTFELIHGLLAETKYGSGEAQWTGSGYVGGSTASLQDVVAALSKLQNDQSAAAPTAGAADVDIKTLLNRALSSEGGSEARSLGRTEDDTIDIVSMLFDVILDDPNLPDTIKALIARLQIPVLKVALAEKAFFSRKNHPARALINELARSAVGWNEPQDVTQDPFYRQVESVVNRVLVGFQQDVTLFETLLEEFRGFLDQERERARQVEERTRQAAEGKAKVDHAKAQVERELTERLAGRDVPPVVEQLLQGPWSKVLFINYLKEGDQGEAFYEKLEVVDRLLGSLERPADGEQRRAMLKEIPALLTDLREGLNSIMFNPFEMTKLFKELEAVHVRLLANPGAEAQAPEVEQPPSEPLDELLVETVEYTGDQVEEPDAAAGGEAGPEREAYMEELASVPVGTWFEFGDASGNCVRAKLSARLNAGRRLIFVNRAGFKLADKILEDMADDLVAGRAVMLDDNMLFDRALETVIVNLRSARTAQGS
ncbi:DUF1631 domain-containing protein [Ectothiorhodospiraceae bacterium WFHF3C12]|nr:DUF1631 domain-containing protein [Ectothiorhodospiraceae bacterium WFHF3C12]